MNGFTLDLEDEGCEPLDGRVMYLAGDCDKLCFVDTCTGYNSFVVASYRSADHKEVVEKKPAWVRVEELRVLRIDVVE